MLRKPTSSQSELEMVTLDMLVPQNHLVRKILKTIDFSFIYERVKSLYSSDNGRPALDPEVLFKILFLGYLFGVRSERQLMREIEVNVAYRWFLGFSLLEKVPDASTLSQNRRRRFNESDIYQSIFDEIVLQAMKRGLVEGKVLYTDSTHLKANANKGKYDLQEVSKSRADYFEALDADIAKDRAEHDKKPIREKPHEPVVKETKISTTDPESGYMVRDGKPKGFFYLDHRTVDGKCNIITDSFATPANQHDSIPYLTRLDRQRERFGFEVQAVGLDAGYSTAGIAKDLDERDIVGVTGYRRPTPPREGMMAKKSFVYDAETDVYLCPEGQALAYQTTDRQGYRHYKSDGKLCKNCPLLASCTTNKAAIRTITRHIWTEIKETMTQNRLTTWGKAIYKRRKETVERSFADAKQLHGHRYAKMRGLLRVTEQCLLSAASQNMKKIALNCA